MEEECQLCTQPFDETTHVPLVLGSCGHTFCRECIKYLEPIIYHPLNRIYSCPVCKKTNLATSPRGRDDEIFARNFAVMSMLEKKKKGVMCDHESQEFICLDNACFNGAVSCLKCVGRLHPTCCDGSIRRLNETHFQTNFKIEDISDAFDCSGLRDAIQRGLAKLETIMLEFADQFAANVNSKKEYFLNAMADPSLVVKNKRNFDFADLGEGRFRVSLQERHIASLKLAVAEVKNFLETTFFDKLEVTTTNFLKTQGQQFQADFGNDFEYKMTKATGRRPPIDFVELFNRVAKNPASLVYSQVSGEVIKLPLAPRGRERKREHIAHKMTTSIAILIDKAIEEAMAKGSEMEAIRADISQTLVNNFKMNNEIRWHFGDPQDAEANRYPTFFKRIPTNEFWIVAEILPK